MKSEWLSIHPSEIWIFIHNSPSNSRFHPKVTILSYSIIQKSPWNPTLYPKITIEFQFSSTTPKKSGRKKRFSRDAALPRYAPLGAAWSRKRCSDGKNCYPGGDSSGINSTLWLLFTIYMVGNYMWNIPLWWVMICDNHVYSIVDDNHNNHYPMIINIIIIQLSWILLLLLFLLLLLLLTYDCDNWQWILNGWWWKIFYYSVPPMDDHHYNHYPMIPSGKLT